MLTRADRELFQSLIYSPAEGWVSNVFQRKGPCEWTPHAPLAKRFTRGQADEIVAELILQDVTAQVVYAGETIYEKQCRANGAWTKYAACPPWRWLKRRYLFNEAVRAEGFATRSALNALMAKLDLDSRAL